MDPMQFTTVINASPQKVWESLWSDATYGEWTAPFTEGSKMVTEGADTVTDWNEGARVLFVDGKNDGMVAEIINNRPHEFIKFRHLAEVKSGKELPDQTYGENYESYLLTEKEGGTILLTELSTAGVPENFIEYFKKTFPPALAKVKEIAERS